MSTTTTDPTTDTETEPEAPVRPGPTINVDERIVPLDPGYVTVDTVPGLRGDGETYDHTRIRVGTGFGAVVVPTVRVRGQVYLGMVHQRRPVLDKDTWEFPRGGTSNLSQSEANRELTEETGLQLDDTSLRFLGVMHPDTGTLTTEVGVWVASVPQEMVRLTRGHLENESGAQVRWMQRDQLTGLVLRRELVCSMTLAAFTMADVAGELHQVL